MGVINLAHGSFYMVGAYLAYWLAKITGSLWLAIPLGLVIALAIGVVLETTLVSRLYKRDHLYQVLLTFGLILIFEELRSILFGDDVHGVAVPALLDYSVRLTDTLSYPVYRLFVTAVCLLLAGSDVFGDPQDPPRHDDPRRQQQSRNGGVARASIFRLLFALVFAFGMALAAFAGSIAAPIIVGVSRHGQSDSDHLLRRRGDRRHRLHQRRDDCRRWRSDSPTPSAKCSRRNTPASPFIC